MAAAEKRGPALDRPPSGRRDQVFASTNCGPSLWQPARSNARNNPKGGYITIPLDSGYSSPTEPPGGRRFVV